MPDAHQRADDSPRHNPVFPAWARLRARESLFLAVPGVSVRRSARAATRQDSRPRGLTALACAPAAGTGPKARVDVIASGDVKNWIKIFSGKANDVAGIDAESIRKI
ncbi:MAG: hypothetical protein FJX59_18160 [Alphaproteobacteria bacterium]|nr:hypothetical protein [Alphaproteobacteria bacterium]